MLEAEKLCKEVSFQLNYFFLLVETLSGKHFTMKFISFWRCFYLCKNIQNHFMRKLLAARVNIRRMGNKVIGNESVSSISCAWFWLWQNFVKYFEFFSSVPNNDSRRMNGFLWYKKWWIDLGFHQEINSLRWMWTEF